jgi:ubiquinone biosynthesis protein
LAKLVAGETTELILARAEATYRANAALAPKARLGARHLLLMSAYAIALHQALTEHGLDPEQAEHLVSDIVFDSIRPIHNFLKLASQALYRSSQRRARWLSRMARRFYYTAPEWRMTDVTVDDGFGFDITRCVVAEYFQSMGMAGLCQRAFCDQDPRIAVIYGAAFERAGTLASGASHCDFRYHIGAAQSG